jgi:hypothetical protein
VNNNTHSTVLTYNIVLLLYHSLGFRTNQCIRIMVAVACQNIVHTRKWLFVIPKDLCIHLLSCRRPSGPKPEIGYDRRGRGVLALTWEKVISREGKRLCCSCYKKEIIRHRNDSKLALNRWVKKGVYRVESYWPQLRRAPNRIWSVNRNVCQHQ